ncbi:MAG: hypothetical protein GF331_14820 [Chitinivibrionales bacterium]|nr:hypothetical protein [Chitinivibrionales bacterium]
MKLLHCADIHLKRTEREYGLRVLEQIVAVALRERVALVLLCGDVFDSFADAEELRHAFGERIAQCGCDVLFLQGNHDEKGAGRAGLATLDLGPVKTIVPAAGSTHTLLRHEHGNEAIEVLALPHRTSYADYTEWIVPEKQTATRIALAHAVVEEMVYAGPQDADIEEGGGTIARDLFVRFGVSYGALGHIHAARDVRTGPSLLRYPGSATVWRRGEEGPRSVTIVETNAGPAAPAVHEVVLDAAGQYRRCVVPLALDAAEPDLDTHAASWGPSDMVEVVLTGMVEDESGLARLRDSLHSRYGGRCRSFSVDSSAVTSAPGISSQPLAKRFLELWRALPDSDPDGPGEDVRNRARELMLKAMADAMRRHA